MQSVAMLVFPHFFFFLTKAESLNIFILHRLRNTFLQLILISLDSASAFLQDYGFTFKIDIPRGQNFGIQHSMELQIWCISLFIQCRQTPLNATRHNSADSVPTSNLIRTTFCIAGIIYHICNLVADIECTRYKNAFNKRF